MFAWTGSFCASQNSCLICKYICATGLVVFMVVLWVIYIFLHISVSFFCHFFFFSFLGAVLFYMSNETLRISISPWLCCRPLCHLSVYNWTRWHWGQILCVKGKLQLCGWRALTNCAHTRYVRKRWAVVILCPLLGQRAGQVGLIPSFTWHFRRVYNWTSCLFLDILKQCRKQTRTQEKEERRRTAMWCVYFLLLLVSVSVFCAVSRCSLSTCRL